MAHIRVNPETRGQGCDLYAVGDLPTRCALTERVCKQASGWLNCEPRALVPSSVYRDIELVTLSRDPNVTLSFGALTR